MTLRVDHVRRVPAKEVAGVTFLLNACVTLKKRGSLRNPAQHNLNYTSLKLKGVGDPPDIRIWHPEGGHTAIRLHRDGNQIL